MISRCYARDFLRQSGKRHIGRDSKCYELYEKGQLVIRLSTTKELRDFRNFVGREMFDRFEIFEIQPYKLR